MTDKEHADAVRAAAAHLNQTLAAATEGGLSVQLEVMEVSSFGQHPKPTVIPHVQRVVAV